MADASLSLAEAMMMEEALVSFHQTGDFKKTVEALKVVVDAYMAKEESDNAMMVASHWLTMIKKTGDKQAEVDVAEMLADVQLSCGDGSAHQTLNDALGLYRQLNQKAGEAKMLLQLAGLKQSEGCNEEALSLAQQALGLFEELGDPKSEDCERIINRACSDSGEIDQDQGLEILTPFTEYQNSRWVALMKAKRSVCDEWFLKTAKVAFLKSFNLVEIPTSADGFCGWSCIYALRGVPVSTLFEEVRASSTVPHRLRRIASLALQGLTAPQISKQLGESAWLTQSELTALSSAPILEIAADVASEIGDFTALLEIAFVADLPLQFQPDSPETLFKSGFRLLVCESISRSEWPPVPFIAHVGCHFFIMTKAENAAVAQAEDEETQLQAELKTRYSRLASFSRPIATPSSPKARGSSSHVQPHGMPCRQDRS